MKINIPEPIEEKQEDEKIEREEIKIEDKSEAKEEKKEKINFVKNEKK